MNTSAVYISGAIGLLLLAGCAGTKAPETIKPDVVQSVEAVVSSADTLSGQENTQLSTVDADKQVQQNAEVTGTEEAPEPKPVMSANRAVLALLDRAGADNGAGKRDAAGASLERALRIEPRNPWLWNELAQVRLGQGQYAQAVTLAKKSNSFASGQKRVQAANWTVIGQAKIALGDTPGAQEAFNLSSELSRQARSDNRSN